jgi:DNA (cytosine-5)-methyltransferase 1
LEAEGYEVQSVVIPACAKNAPHRRSRIWLVGKYTTKSEQSLVNTNSFRSYKHKTTEKKSPIRRTKTSIATTSYNVANTFNKRSQRGLYRWKNKKRQDKQRHIGCSSTAYKQPKERAETVVSKMGDMADGISTGLLRHFDREPEHIPRVTTGEKDRAKKLKALGNSIVPQVAAEILLAIRVSEESD